MEVEEKKVASKGAQPVIFKLHHKFTVFLWDSNYLDHLDEIDAEEPDASFVFGQKNKKHPHPSAFYIASVMSSILHRTNDNNPLIAKVATEMTHSFNSDLAKVYDDLYKETQTIKQRLADEQALFDNKEENVDEAFDSSDAQGFSLIAPPRIVTKNLVLLVRTLKVLDNAVCDLEKLTQLCVVTPPVFHKEKRALANPLRNFFLDVSTKAKRFHAKRKELQEQE